MQVCKLVDEFTNWYYEFAKLGSIYVKPIPFNLRQSRALQALGEHVICQPLLVSARRNTPISMLGLALL
eukprot:scaffold28463_cov64-Attheya_sp.AAC.5